MEPPCRSGRRMEETASEGSTINGDSGGARRVELPTGGGSPEGTLVSVHARGRRGVLLARSGHGWGRSG
ncbi:formin-like protein 6 [Iris pallida]|uniref:Formin-like protein 6 n=1 Tax=Iris pallida TaxID=29817 RepID=A0AAX6E1D4_IRIPA|nr:formin-like protein 6 [Iris pallida]